MASTVSTAAAMDVDAMDDLKSILASQRVELMDFESLESDLDLAFRLQLHEAITASVAHLPSASTSPPPPPQQQQGLPHDAVSPTFASLQTEELTKMEQELADRERAKLELRKAREDLQRRIHDQNFAKELSRIPDEEWAESGDYFEKPFGEGSSKSVEDNGDNLFRLYTKGLVCEEVINGEKVLLFGIGIAICDENDNLIFEVKKSLTGNGMSKITAEATALIEGLDAALALELTRVRFYCDYYPLHQLVTGRWPAKQQKTAVLVNQVDSLERKFRYCNPRLVARKDMKFVFELAQAAINSQITAPVEPSHGKNIYETCTICLEDTDVGHMFSIDECLHRYCFSCMKQHVQEKMRQAMVPTCPHEGCKSELKVESCRKFLTSDLLETLNQCIREASIPVSEKVYCPYPRCSALMSKSEVEEYARRAFFIDRGRGARKCIKCDKSFCMKCKVPWHNSMSCNYYRRLNPNPPTEDVKLKSLALRNMWRQCLKCNHMIELSEGCYHMKCRCGNEFCYSCGAQWKNKKATCDCPLWDEDHILYDGSDADSDEDEDEDGDDLYWI